MLLITIAVPAGAPYAWESKSNIIGTSLYIVYLGGTVRSLLLRVFPSVGYGPPGESERTRKTPESLIPTILQLWRWPSANNRITSAQKEALPLVLSSLILQRHTDESLSTLLRDK